MSAGRNQRTSNANVEVKRFASCAKLLPTHHMVVKGSAFDGVRKFVVEANGGNLNEYVSWSCDEVMQPTPDIAVLWKKRDGTSCVLSKRGTTLVLSVQRDGGIVMEKAVESPTEAMDLAKTWKTLPIRAPS